jgi:hypothetical protein
MSANDFIIEFLEKTWQNPFCDSERVLFDVAALALLRRDEVITISMIRALRERRKGEGSLALDWLCDLADKHDVILSGYIKPAGTTRPRLTVQQLTKWYQSRGFQVAGRIMCRTPKKVGLLQRSAS